MITQVLSHSKYPVVFFFFLIDGSTTNFVASSLSANGVFNVWVILIGAIVLEICLDLVYYHLGGKLSEAQIFSRVNKGNQGNFLKTLDRAYKSRPGITLMVVKFLGPFAIPGILYMGKLKVLSVPKFIEYGAIVAVTRATLLSFMGYMVGKGIGQFAQAYSVFTTLGTVIIVFAIIFIIYKIYQKKIDMFFLNIFKKIK